MGREKGSISSLSPFSLFLSLSSPTLLSSSYGQGKHARDRRQWRGGLLDKPGDFRIPFCHLYGIFIISPCLPHLMLHHLLLFAGNPLLVLQQATKSPPPFNWREEE